MIVILALFLMSLIAMTGEVGWMIAFALVPVLVLFATANLLRRLAQNCPEHNLLFGAALWLGSIKGGHF